MKDQLERSHGAAHVIFNWRGDWRWPDKESFNGHALNHRLRVAEFTWYRLAGRGHPVTVTVAEGWSTPVVPFYPNETLENDLCVIRVNLARQTSQYIGWLPQSEFGEIRLSDVSHDPRRPRMRRVVAEWMLKRSWPPCLVNGNGQA